MHRKVLGLPGYLGRASCTQYHAVSSIPLWSRSSQLQPPANPRNERPSIAIFVLAIASVILLPLSGVIACACTLSPYPSARGKHLDSKDELIVGAASHPLHPFRIRLCLSTPKRFCVEGNTSCLCRRWRNQATVGSAGVARWMGQTDRSLARPEYDRGSMCSFTAG